MLGSTDKGRQHVLLRVRAKRTHAPTPDQNEVGGDNGGLIILQANDGCDERPDPLGGGLDVVVWEIVVQRPTLTPLDPVKSISYGADRRAIYAPINSLC